MAEGKNIVVAAERALGILRRGQSCGAAMNIKN